MVNDLKTIILAGIGSVAYTYEKASGIVQDLVNKGKLTVEEGKDLSEELKRTIKDKTSKTQDTKPLTKEDLASFFKEMNFATKSDIDEINQRVAALEEKIK